MIIKDRIEKLFYETNLDIRLLSFISDDNIGREFSYPEKLVLQMNGLETYQIIMLENILLSVGRKNKWSKLWV